MKNKPTIAISPVSNDYLTKGKEYGIIYIEEVIKEDLGHYFQIINDNGKVLISHEHNPLHTNGLSWTLK